MNEQEGIPANLRDNAASDGPRPRTAFFAVASVVILLAVVAVLVGCGLDNPRTTRGPIPTSLSPVVGSFVQEVDGRFGYEILRPAGWTALDGEALGRIYFDAEDGPHAQVMLTVGNLEVIAREFGAPDTSYPDWEAFRTAGNLDGWTAAIEQRWRAANQPFTLVKTLPNAKVYATSYPDGSQFGLFAYVVDAGKPLTVGMSGGGSQPSFEPLERLASDGLLADFLTMVRSVRATDATPTNELRQGSTWGS